MTGVLLSDILDDGGSSDGGSSLWYTWWWSSQPPSSDGGSSLWYTWWWSLYWELCGLYLLLLSVFDFLLFYFLMEEHYIILFVCEAIVLLISIWRCEYIRCQQLYFLELYLKRGSRPFIFENTILSYGLGWWPGQVPTTWGWFWVHARNASHVRPRSKKQTAKRKEVELSFYTIRPF